MPIHPWRPLDPEWGDHYLMFERPFRYVVEDPEHTWRRVWIPTVVACPVCEIDTGLRIAHKLGQDVVVEAACPAGHVWLEPRVDVSQWMAYCRFRAGQMEIDWVWLMEAGFGEEPPPPIDYVEEIRRGAVEIAKYGQRKAKAKVRSKVRTVKKKAAKRIKNEAMRPVAAFLRTAWTMQAGGAQPVTPARRRREPKPPKTPPVAAYRKAYGMEAPKKGPKCLVCDDSGRINAPGISIPCTECSGSVKATTAAAIVKAQGKRAVADDKRAAARDVAHAEAAEQRAAARRTAEEEAAEKAAEKKAAAEEAAKETAAEEKAAEKKAAEKRGAAQKKAAEEKAAAQKRTAQKRAAKEKAAAEEAARETAAVEEAAREKAAKATVEEAAEKAARGRGPGRVEVVIKGQQITVRSEKELTEAELAAVVAVSHHHHRRVQTARAAPEVGPAANAVTSGDRDDQDDDQ